MSFRRANLKKTASELELRAMVRSGLNAKEIASALGRSHSAVRAALATLGISTQAWSGRCGDHMRKVHELRRLAK